MANIAITHHKVTGSRKAVADLWKTLQDLEVNSKDVYLHLLAEHYGIDYEKKGISVRGHIYWAEYEENEKDDYALLSFDTESAWSSCDMLFDEVNKALGYELSISWREVEPGCGIIYTHDENDFFPEECYVTAYGDLFDDCEGAYSTIGDAIEKWCEITGISQDGRTELEMTDFINDFEYEDENTGFCINSITFG
ncbi:MAG: hypothetical protein LUD00_12550 [Prevotellaceae bacterium]|nr:hypothetical protein [Prevotellaceae bacterium]